jgi:hypothetical protein
VAQGFLPGGLGPLVLRTETAMVAALSVVTALFLEQAPKAPERRGQLSRVGPPTADCVFGRAATLR